MIMYIGNVNAFDLDIFGIDLLCCKAIQRLTTAYIYIYISDLDDSR